MKTVDTIQDQPAVSENQLEGEKKWNSISGLRERVEVPSVESTSAVDLMSDEGMKQVWGIIRNIYRKCQRILGMDSDQANFELNRYQGGFESKLNIYASDIRVQTIYRFLYFGFHMDLQLDKYLREEFYEGKEVGKVISDFKRLTALIIIALCELYGFDLKGIKVSSLYKVAAKDDELEIAENAARVLMGKSEGSQTKITAVIAFLIHIHDLI
ncbi:MAG: hypothetical protein ACRCZE_02725 [Candidatus Altimarinota bacterium]